MQLSHPAALDALRSPPGTRVGVYVFCALVALIWFGALEHRGLFWPDEGRYAEIAAEMLSTGDWITPRLNGLQYFEKPPLQYWTIAAIFEVFGQDEWTARLWPAIAGFAGLIALGFARPFGASNTRMAALLLSASWGYFLASQFLTLDIGLTVFLTGALIAFLHARRAAGPGEAAGPMLLAWICMALAVLTKGPVGVVLPALAMTGYFVLTRDRRVFANLNLRAGVPLFLAITVPWFVTVQARNPSFFDFFFIHEHLQRFAEPGHHRPGPLWYFLPVLAVGLMPWTPLVPAALAHAWRSDTGEGFRARRFVLLWALVVIGFFSISRSKLPAYVLPAAPALLLLIADWLNRAGPRMRRLPAWLSGVLGVGTCLGAAWLALTAEHSALSALLPAYAPWLAGAGLTLMVCAIASLWFEQRHRRHTALVALVIGNLLAVQLALSGTHTLDAFFSSEQLIERAFGDKPNLDPAVPFYSVGMFDQTVPFYLHRPVTLVAHKDELAAGIAAEPAKYVESIDAFGARWRTHDQAYAVMRPAMQAQLAATGLPMRVLGTDGERTLIARR